MGDSEDEYDRKRRDKFRGERAEANYRGTDRSVRPRDEWSERDAWSRPRPRDYRGPVRDRGYSPSLEPAAKRLRHDYYGDSYYNHYPSYHPTAHRESQAPTQVDGQQPPMMSFKAFLATQDDNISDSEAIEKYNDYKLEFQRQQLNEFFVAHKDDEWFRLKYHPEDAVKRKEDQMNALRKRVGVFVDLLNGKKLDKITVDCLRTNDLVKLLDTVVIKLEGGTDEDLGILEEEYADVEERKHEPVIMKIEEKKPEEVDNNTNKKEEEGEIKDVEEKDDDVIELKTNGNVEEKNAKDDDDEEVDEEEGEKSKENVEEEKPNNDDEVEEEGEEKMDTETVEEKEENPQNEITEPPAELEEGEEKKKNDKKRKRSYSGSSSSSSSSSSDSEEEKEKPKEEKKEEDEVIKEEVKEISPVIEENKIERPRALHKTTSIFLRSLAPTITRQEVEAMCSRYDGFLRVALADPQPERRWLRRGWVTFKRDANIKEICWNLNNIRLRDCELGAIVNRDLSRRIRPINGITAHKQVVRSDIRISAKVALHLDSKAGLWPDEEAKKDKPQQTFGLVSNNPILHNITDYLIEEASAEEEELLGLEPSSDTQDSASTVERDDALLSVLDKIILYLRVVHSVDYYNHCEYPNEDEMPNRCGILHARGPAPTTKTDITQFIGAPIETKMANFLPEKTIKDENKNDTKLINLSLKDVDMEIDKFVQANTRELAKDKWLCPLSGKKFKGPDFVRKHIFNKHGEKIEEVKKEVEFFNNYLRDPKRPVLAEPQQPKREEQQPTYNHPTYSNSYYGPPRYYNQGYNTRPRGYTPRTRGGGNDFRPVIHYRDLDAPREPEEFI